MELYPSSIHSKIILVTKLTMIVALPDMCRSCVLIKRPVNGIENLHNSKASTVPLEKNYMMELLYRKNYSSDTGQNLFTSSD